MAKPKSALRWKKDWRGHKSGQALTRKLFRDFEIHAYVYMHAGRKGEWVANIESNDSGGRHHLWVHVNRIQFKFKTRRQAQLWVAAQVPLIRRAIRDVLRK